MAGWGHVFDLLLPEGQMNGAGNATCGATLAHREFIDGYGGQAAPVPGQLGDVAQLLQVPQDAAAVPRAADDDAVSLGGGQAGDSIRVSIQHLKGDPLRHFTSSSALPEQPDCPACARRSGGSHLLEAHVLELVLAEGDVPYAQHGAGPRRDQGAWARTNCAQALTPLGQALADSGVLWPETRGS